MTGTGGTNDVFGRSVEDAARALSGRIDPDSDAIASALRTVAEEGTVTSAAVDDAIGDASLALSTAEGRVEYATVEVQNAREALAEAPASSYLEARAATLESRGEELAAERDRLQSDLQDTVDKRGDPGALYDLARELERLETAADSLQGRSDQLAADADDLAQFVTDPLLVLPDVAADVDALEAAIEETTAAVDTLTDDPAGSGIEEPSTAWFEVWADHQFRRLAIADVGAELDALDTLHDEAEISALSDRHGELTERWRRVADRLVAAVPEDWVAEHERRMEAVTETVKAYEPPIEWGEVDERREELLGGDRDDQ